MVSVQAPFVPVGADLEEASDLGQAFGLEASGPVEVSGPEEASDLEEDDFGEAGLEEALGPEEASALVRSVLEGPGFRGVENPGKEAGHADLIAPPELVLDAMVPLAAVLPEVLVLEEESGLAEAEWSGSVKTSVQRVVVCEPGSAQAMAADPSRAFFAAACGSEVEEGRNSGATGAGLVVVLGQGEASVAVGHVLEDIDPEVVLGLGVFGLEAFAVAFGPVVAAAAVAVLLHPGWIYHHQRILLGSANSVSGFPAVSAATNSPKPSYYPPVTDSGPKAVSAAPQAHQTPQFVPESGPLPSGSAVGSLVELAVRWVVDLEEKHYCEVNLIDTALGMPCFQGHLNFEATNQAGTDLRAGNCASRNLVCRVTSSAVCFVLRQHGPDLRFSGSGSTLTGVEMGFDPAVLVMKEAIPGTAARRPYCSKWQMGVLELGRSAPHWTSETV